LNNNFTWMKGKFFFLVFCIGFIIFLLVSGATGTKVFTGSQRTHNTSKVYEASSSRTPYFNVDPLEVRGIMSPNEFLVKINVTDAPETHTWEFSLSWNSSLLERIGDAEGDFLKRGGLYETIYTAYPISAAQVEVTCSLKGNSSWASGDGWLCTLSFRVKALGSCVLNLSETRLWDHIYLGYPGYTYYSNRDGFFYNQPIHDVAVTAITASPTKVKAGELVTINVTVVNEGNYSETFTVAFYADINASKYLYEYFSSEYVFEIRSDRGRLIDVRDDVGNEITVGTQAVTDLGTTTTLTLTWNTTGVEGNYTLSAGSLLLDDDTRDNMYIDGIVTINPPALPHDVAITNVVPSPTEVTVGENVDINVTVKNEGSFAETFNVTVYRGDTAIATQTSITLTNGTTTTLTFTWDTTGVPEGTYTISAKVPPLSSEREADKADNTYTDGTVTVQGVPAPAPSILPYVVAAVAIIIVVAVAIYIIKFRKPSGRR
jgi:hypothetical protein